MKVPGSLSFLSSVLVPLKKAAVFREDLVETKRLSSHSPDKLSRVDTESDTNSASNDTVTKAPPSSSSSSSPTTAVRITSEYQLIRFARDLLQASSSSSLRHDDESNHNFNSLNNSTQPNAIKSLFVSFDCSPNDKARKALKMKQLGEIFFAIGQHLSSLEEIIFDHAALYLPSINKMFAAEDGLKVLQSLKFRHCHFILARSKDSPQVSQLALDNFLNGIHQQSNLHVLEIVNCSTTTLSHGEKHNKTFVYQLSSSSRKNMIQSQLRRLVLDECLLVPTTINSSTSIGVGAGPGPGTNSCPDGTLTSAGWLQQLLQYHSHLQEVEIRPLFDVDSLQRRHQYHAKKQAIRTMLMETIPKALVANANNNQCCLKRLVVSIKDYHLEPVYEEVMEQWLELVQDHPALMVDWQLTHLPLMQCTTTDTANSPGFLESEEMISLRSLVDYYVNLNKTSNEQEFRLSQDIEDLATCSVASSERK